jgi:hypothetical protein
MHKLLSALLALSIGASLQASEGFSSLEEQMTGKEFSAAGLNKLSQEELNSLNAWIRSRSLATLDVPAAATTGAATAATATDEASEDMRGFEGSKGSDEERTTITSRIVGKFDGWDGQTVFRLENGMIWVQADKKKTYIREVENPVVHIEPGFFGSWRLNVEGEKADCKVRRIQ